MDTTIPFFIAAAVAAVATAMVITRASAVHALLYLVVSLLAVAVVFYLMGAPFVAALEVIVYAGAIMVLFVFVIMMLNVGPKEAQSEKDLLAPRIWAGPSLLAAVLLGELVYVTGSGAADGGAGQAVVLTELGKAVFGPYLLGVELVSLLLLAGLVGAYHLGLHARLQGPGEGGGR